MGISTTSEFFFAKLRTNAWLVWTLSRRQYSQRYKGSILGSFLPIFYTFATLAIYSLVFSVILRVKWDQAGIPETENTLPFWIVLFSGQIFFQFASEILVQGPSIVSAVPNYVKKIIFPLHLLPFVMLLVATFTFFMNFGLLLLATAVWGKFHITLLFFPFIFLQGAIWALGLGWLLGALGVFIRDLQQLMMVFSQILLFATPIFYPASIVPERFSFIMKINPLCQLVEGLRDVLLWGRLPDVPCFFLWTVLACCFAWASFWIFKKLRPTFADVM